MTFIDLSDLFKDNIVGSLIKRLCFNNSRALARDIVNASSHDAYIETVSKSADTVHNNLVDWEVSFLEKEFARMCEQKLKKMHFGICDVIIDSTDEDFYGKVDSLWLHPWTGEKGVLAHYKFLVCIVKYRNTKIPVAVKMLALGDDIAKAVGFLLQACKNAGLNIRNVLLDRGFYNAEVIQELQKQEFFYLIFARKSKKFNCMLEGMQKSCKINHEMIYNKNKTKNRVETDIAFVKDYHEHDWIFATNLEITGFELVKKYRIRWNIETIFRIQDEARIRTKSKRSEVRLFCFLVALLLLLVWQATQKNKVSFKKFLIKLFEEANMLLQKNA